VRPIQHVFHGGLLDPMPAISLVGHLTPTPLISRSRLRTIWP
jgi:hypothetical protein